MMMEGSRLTDSTRGHAFLDPIDVLVYMGVALLLGASSSVIRSKDVVEDLEVELRHVG